MSRNIEPDEDDDWVDVTPEERAELEAAIAEADANPEGFMDFDEFMRRLKSGESFS